MGFLTHLRMRSSFLSRRVLFAAISVLIFLHFSNAQERQSIDQQPIISKDIFRSELIFVKKETLTEFIRATGSLEAIRSNTISTPVSASAQTVNVREGEQVKGGEVIAQLDTQTAKAELRQKQNALKIAETQLKVVEEKLKGQRELFKQNFISQLALNELQADYNVRFQQLKSSEDAVAVQRKIVNDHTIRAPFDGFIYSRTIEPGQWVISNSPLFKIVDLSRLEMKLLVSERDIHLVKAGQYVNFTVEGNSKIYDAKVSRVNPVLNAGSRTFTIYVTVENDDSSLRIGQFGTAQIILRSVENVDSLPIHAVRQRRVNRGGVSVIENWILVVGKDGMSKEVVVKVGLQDKERKMFQIIDGISRDEPIISTNIIGVGAGMKINII